MTQTLAAFSRTAIDEIVEEWAEFARTNIDEAQLLAPEELRDHAHMILTSVADDIERPQSDEAQHQKSRGERPNNAPAVTRAAQQDADERFRQRFPLNAVIAEYRALRASVIRRWSDEGHASQPDAIVQLTRFNEGIDQAIGEAVTRYVDRVNESRNLMLGVLGHDLRNPLGAIRSSSDYLLLAGELLPGQTKAALLIQTSANRMREMIHDLLDFTRGQLGGSMPVALRDVDLAQVCQQVVSELQALHPERTVRLEAEGDLGGHWDEHRLAQAVSNLAANAIQHGDPDKPVCVRALQSGKDGVLIQVHNWGPPISLEGQRCLFNALMRPVVREAELREGSSGLGLGLYIVQQIAWAHGGEVAVRSTESEGTTMELQLPRRAAPVEACVQTTSTATGSTRS